MTDTDVTMTDIPGGNDWRIAGEAWGHAADDWSCLHEHYAMEVLLAMYPALGIGPGTRFLDVACGAGMGARVASGMGASIAGIDAAADLVDIACLRLPEADIRVGSMFDLPWSDSTFDVAVSINGIWGGCAAALDETFRVLRRGGRIGISFWGQGPPLDLRTVFKVFAAHAPVEHLGSMRRLNNISVPGVAETMLADSGFVVTDVGQRISVVEWPDPDVAWRALSSVGPAVPALAPDALDEVRHDVLAAADAWRDTRGIYRMRNDHRYVVAAKP